MSKKKVKERIAFYAMVSGLNHVAIHDFRVLYSSEKKMYLIYLDFTDTEDNVKLSHKEIECYDGKGWLVISSNFKHEDFENVFKEAKASKFNVKSVVIKPK